MGTLGEILNTHTREGDLWEPIDKHRIRCYACGHECPIPDGALGVCEVRFNRGGRALRVRRPRLSPDGWRRLPRVPYADPWTLGSVARSPAGRSSLG